MADESEQLLSLAQQAAESGQVDRAVELYLEIAAGSVSPGPFVVQAGATLHQAGRFEEASTLYRRVLAQTPDDPMANLLEGVARLYYDDAAAAVTHLRVACRAPDISPDAWLFLGRALMAEYLFDEAVDALTRARDAMPGNSEASYLLAGALQDGGDPEKAADVYRDTLAEIARETGNGGTEPWPLKLRRLDSRMQVRFINQSLNARAKLIDFSDRLATDDLGRNILVACQMKSGSTFLVRTLSTLLGWNNVNLVPYPVNDAALEIDLAQLEAYATGNNVFQQHSRCTDATRQAIDAYGLHPVVLVRDVFDALISLTDHVAGAPPSFHQFGDFTSWDRARQIDAVIDRYAPWYIEIYASWRRMTDDGRVSPVWLTYETLFADTHRAIETVVAHAGLDIDTKSIDAAIAAVGAAGEKTRLNKGVSGRGRDEMSATQQNRIRGLLRYYRSHPRKWCNSAVAKSPARASSIAP